MTSADADPAGTPSAAMDTPEDAGRWIVESGYVASLGASARSLTPELVVLDLPFQEQNSNPGKALHGGCAASLGVIGAQAIARLNLGAAMAPFHTAALQVNYLAAAIDEPVTSSTALDRKGKELCFSDTVVSTAAGKTIARIEAVVRGRSGALSPGLRTARRDAGGAEPGTMGPSVAAMPFSTARGFKVDHMTESYARIRMPFSTANGDASGSFHEGAMLALLDTTGAMAAWADTGPGPFKASTASIQAQIISAPTTSELVAYGWLAQRDGELFLADVEVADAQTSLVHARGTVVYRIVT